MRRSLERTLTIKQPRHGVGGNAFEAQGVLRRAVVLPMSGTAASQTYGLRPDEMVRLIGPPELDIERGMGVCVDVAAQVDPDYRVLYVARWPRHIEAHLKYIPAGERGADE